MKLQYALCAPLLLVSSLVAATGCSDDEGAVACAPEEQSDMFSVPPDVAPPQPESLEISTQLNDPNISSTTVVLVVALDDALTHRVLFETAADGSVSVDDPANDAPGSSQIMIDTTPDKVASITVSGLTPSTTYYYRFYYAEGDSCIASPLGQQSTTEAPAP